MIDRRTFLGIVAVAGSTLAMSPQLLSAQQLSGKLIERAIPSSGEKIPVIGLAFSNHPGCAGHAALKEVVKTFADNGGRYFDATLGNAASQQFHTKAASELGIANKVFWSTPAFFPAPGAGAAGVKTQIDSVLARTKASRIDLAWVNAAGDPALLAALKEEKKAGRIRYIGVQTIVVKNQSAQLEALMRNEPIDFIGVDYDIGNRVVEETILPLAREKKIGVIAFFPFSNNSGVSCGTLSRNLFARVGTTPLPEWAAEFDAKTWAQFFLKYVLATRPSRWPAWGRPRRTTCSTTWAAASAVCRMKRHGSAWRRSSMHFPRFRRLRRTRRRRRGSRCRRPPWSATSVSGSCRPAPR